MIYIKGSTIAEHDSIHKAKMRRLVFVLFTFISNADQLLDERLPLSKQASNTPLNGKHLRLITIPV